MQRGLDRRRAEQRASDSRVDAAARTRKLTPLRVDDGQGQVELREHVCGLSELCAGPRRAAKIPDARQLEHQHAVPALEVRVAPARSLDEEVGSD